jgi:hypothetical protein
LRDDHARPRRGRLSLRRFPAPRPADDPSGRACDEAGDPGAPAAAGARAQCMRPAGGTAGGALFGRPPYSDWTGAGSGGSVSPPPNQPVA